MGVRVVAVYVESARYTVLLAHRPAGAAVPPVRPPVAQTVASAAVSGSPAAVPDLLHGYGLCAVEPGCDPAFAAVTIEARARQDMDL